MKQLLLSGCLAFVLGGCASVIMERYIGKPISEAIMDHGMPTTAFDTEPGKRAFVWVKTSMLSLGGSSTTTGSLVGNHMFSSTYVSPTITTSQSCQYVAYAERFRTDVEGPASWRITGFRKPSLMCE